MTKIIDKEVAIEEFERFAGSMDLDMDESTMDDDDIKNLNKMKNRLIKATMEGHLVINEKGEAVYTPSNEESRNKDPITFHERTGASLMAMDGKGKNHDAARMYAILGDMCRVKPKVFAGLVGIDVKISEALFALLMD